MFRRKSKKRKRHFWNRIKSCCSNSSSVTFRCFKNEDKKNYVMRKVNVPKGMTLPNDRTFIARYKHMSTSQLPANVILKRTCRQRAAPRGTRRKRRRGEEEE